VSALGQGDEAPVPGPTPRRGNGLQAATYVAIADLDPRLADAMLDALREEGVAAYAVSITHRQHGDFTLPRYRPLLDRLHVDSTATDDARALLDRRLPEIMADFPAPEREPEQLTDDEIWASIVAAYNAPAAEPVRRWPASEDVPDEHPPEARADEEPAKAAGPAGPAEPAAPEAPAPTGERPPAAPRPAEEHFVPPPPPPLPTADAVTRFAWAGLVGGPLFFLLTAILQMRAASWLAVLAVAAFVAGFVTLVARMKERGGDDETGPDDGAVV
jgi:hypothetical protein